MVNPFSLEGKTILVTGASSGIGQSIAQRCADFGANCIVTGRNEVRLGETYASLCRGGHLQLIADLSSAESVVSFVEKLPKLDGVVSCAGIVETTLLKFSDESELQKVFNTNTFSSIRLIRELVSRKNLKKGSSIVIISSISGVKCGYIGGSLYGASKGALEGFIKAVALELSPQRIRVNTIVPGMVNTHLLDKSHVDVAQLEEDIQRYPLKRYGNPDDIAYGAIYLLSDSSQWVTGSSLLIDGGYTLN